jgi:2-hydroxy-3-oxopropionate reductase
LTARSQAAKHAKESTVKEKEVAKLGFVGLGIMGRPMMNNLVKAGHSVVAYTRNASVLDACVAAGAQRGASSRDVGARADVIFTMLPDGPEVEAVVLGPDGILEGTQAGAVVVDMSSINPMVAQRVGRACAVKGVEFLDAPVSGGEPKAIDGTLAIMVGGDPEVFQKVEPLFRCMGSSATLTGPVGAGNTTKLANQIMVACNIAAMGEALALATRCGLDPEVVVNAIKGGLAGSAVLNAKGPMLIGRNFKPGFRIRLHQKDLRNALQTAESTSVALPLTAAVQQMISALMADGKGDLDHSAIATVAEGLSHVEIKRPS